MLYKRKGTKNWLLDITGPTGRVRRSSGTEDYQQAQLEHARLQLKLSGPVFEKPKPLQDVTVEELTAQFLAYEAKREAASLSSHFASACLALERWCGPGRRLSTLTVQALQLFHADTTTRTGPSTANRYMGAIQPMLGLAVDWGMIASNPAIKVKRHPENLGRRRFLSQTEQRQLLTVCNPGIWPLVFVALRTGLRRGELVRLRKRDVDFSRGLITLYKSKTFTPRYMTLLPEVREILFSLAAGKPDDGFLFVSKRGKPYQPHSITQGFERAAIRAKLADVTFHDLRHTFASDMLAAGVDLVVIQELLGHASIKTTQRYAHLDNNRTREAMELLGAYLTAQSEPFAAQSRQK